MEEYNNLQIFSGERRSGKTTDLINLASEKGYYIVCADRKRVEYVAKLAKEYNASIPYLLTFQEFLTRTYFGHNIKGFLIDDLDDFLRYIEPKIKGFSITK